MTSKTQGTSQCLVSEKDYLRHWLNRDVPNAKTYIEVTYHGAERRVTTHDRRWVACGGRRRFDRKRS